MGWFDRFRSTKPAAPPPVSLEQISCDVAYFILPHFAFREPAKLADLWRNSPAATGPFFYLMAARARQVEPDITVAQQFRWHHGTIAGGRDYSVLEHPSPAPIDLADAPIESMLRANSLIALAPYFTAIISGADADPAYFILGQAPIGGGTTLRSLSPEGINANLGPGPAPGLAEFLAAVAAQLE